MTKIERILYLQKKIDSTAKDDFSEDVFLKNKKYIKEMLKSIRAIKHDPRKC